MEHDKTQHCATCGGTNLSSNAVEKRHWCFDCNAPAVQTKTHEPDPNSLAYQRGQRAARESWIAFRDSLDRDTFWLNDTGEQNPAWGQVEGERRAALISMAPDMAAFILSLNCREFCSACHPDSEPHCPGCVLTKELQDIGVASDERPDLGLCDHGCGKQATQVAGTDFAHVCDDHARRPDSTTHGYDDEFWLWLRRQSQHVGTHWEDCYQKHPACAAARAVAASAAFLDECAFNLDGGSGGVGGAALRISRDQLRRLANA